MKNKTPPPQPGDIELKIAWIFQRVEHELLLSGCTPAQIYGSLTAALVMGTRQHFNQAQAVEWFKDALLVLSGESEKLN